MANIILTGCVVVVVVVVVVARGCVVGASVELVFPESESDSGDSVDSASGSESESESDEVSLFRLNRASSRELPFVMVI